MTVSAAKFQSVTGFEGPVTAFTLGWPNAIPLADFQRIMLLVATAASNPDQERIWTEQGAYLQTEAGKDYLNDIYKRRINLRNKMEPHRWRLRTE
jgi:hypothetical protein